MSYTRIKKVNFPKDYMFISVGKYFLLFFLFLFMLSCDDDPSNSVKKCTTAIDCPGGLCDLVTGDCVSYKCTDMENNCIDDKTASVCNEDHSAMEEKVCPKGCYNGYCIEKKICSVNEKQCISGRKFIKCSDSGAAWIEDECDTGTACLNGECIESVCIPDEKSCEGKFKVKQCNSNGTFLMEYLCDGERECREGECVDVDCDAGAKRCKDDSTLEVCKSDGSGWESSECGTDNKCDIDECKAVVCSSGDKRCLESNNRFYEVCNDLGTGWKSIVSCDVGTVCSEGECVEKVCTPDERSCSDTGKVQICSSDSLSWNEESACGAGEVCKYGNCVVSNVCDANVKECLSENPNYFKQCDEFGTSYLSPVACGAGKTCDNGNCVVILCAPDSKRCVPADIDRKSFEICNSLGTAYNDAVNCENNQICLGGECHDKNCQPSEKTCDGNTLKQCDETANWQTVETCSNGNGCTLDGCKPIICTSGEIRCNPDNARYKEECNADGTAWINRVPCGDGTICDSALCKAIICTPEDKKCNENSVEKCNDNGTAYLLDSNCTNTQYCNSGLCVDQTCTPNSKECTDSTHIKVCNDIGSSFSNPAECAPNTKCVTDECLPIICQSGDTRCNGENLETCSADQLSWNSVSCGAGKTCQAGVCVDYACDASEKECVGNAVYHECNSSRTGFGEPIACGVNKICVGDGDCVTRTCSPGQIRCIASDDKKAYEICNATGSAWTGPANCGDELFCDVDTNICKSKVCNAGDIRCLDEDNPKSQTCNASGTGWNSAVTCGGANPICTETGCDNVICTAYEEIDCTGDTTFRRCNINGTDWIAGSESCATNYLCKNKNSIDQCVPKICTPNSKVCSSDHGYKNCNADGTELSAETTCENDTASGSAKTCYAGSCKTACEMSEINKSYMGCEYYAVELRNYTGYSNGTYAIIVSNPGANTVAVDITGPNNIHVTANISSGALETFTFPDASRNMTPEGSGAGSNYSYLLRSNLPVVVYQFSPLGGANNYTNDASLLMPTTAYGDEYRVMSWRAAWTTYPEYTTIVAKEDNTSVTIKVATATDAGGGVPSISSGGSYTRILSKGDILQVANGTGNLTGSHITSTKPIGVFGGNRCTQIPIGVTACDHIEQQLFPTNTWGSNYLVVKASPRGTENDYYKIVSNQDGTVVTFTPSSIHSQVTLNAGGVVELNTKLDFKVTSSRPIMIGQFIPSQDSGAGTGDPAFILQVPTEQFREDYLFLVPNTYTYDFVTIVAPISATVRLDGNIVASNLFVNIGSTGYKRARIALTDGTHSVIGTEPVGISVYGYDRYVSYGYPGGLNLKDVK